MQPCVARTAGVANPSTRMRPSCFTENAASHADGEWWPRRGARPYTIKPKLWEDLGTAIKRSTPQHYGRCDEAVPNRSLYEWRSASCLLRQWNTSDVCTILSGRSLLMVGDSTVFQLWLSFSLLLGATLGKNVKRASTVTEVTASACANSSRLAFVRNDLLTYTTSSGDFNRIKGCDGYTALNPFVQRATRDADILILGVGHHFPGSLDMAINAHRDPSREQKMAYHAFFPSNLNHTLNMVLRARSLWGHTDGASSVLLVGTSTPVAGCSRFSEPISLSRFVRANYDHRRTVDSPMCASWPSSHPNT